MIHHPDTMLVPFNLVKSKDIGKKNKGVEICKQPIPFFQIPFLTAKGNVLTRNFSRIYKWNQAKC